MVEYFACSITTYCFGTVEFRASNMNDANDFINRFKGEWETVRIKRCQAPEIPKRVDPEHDRQTKRAI